MFASRERDKDREKEQADKDAKEKALVKETADISSQLDRMRIDRTEILHGAQNLTDFLTTFEKGYNAASSEEFPSPEQMETLLQDIEFQKEKSIQALTDICKSMDKLGHTSNTDVTVDDELDVESKETKKIGEDHSKRVSSLVAKLTAIFSKSKKAYTDVLHSFTTDDMDLDSDVKGDSEANVEQALIPMLQQKIVHLKKDVELSRMKSQSLQVQWTADKIRYEDILAHVRHEIQSVSQKLVVAESKKRFREQSERDDNMIVESVSRVEHNYIVAELEASKLRQAAVELELLEKKMNIDQLNSEIQLKVMDIINLDRKAATLEQRLELATQAKDHFQKKHEESVAAFEQKLIALKEELDRQRQEKAENVDENNRLKREQSSLMEQIASVKRENDEYFRFLHKAEEDNKMLRSLTNDLQSKLGPALADKEDFEKKLAMKSVELSAAHSEVDAVKGQLWKVINATKMFAKSFTRSMSSNPIEDKLVEQQLRMNKIQNSFGQLQERVIGLSKSREAIIRDRNKEKMMRKFAESHSSPVGDEVEVPPVDMLSSDEVLQEETEMNKVDPNLSATATVGDPNIELLQLELDRLKRSEAKKTSQLQEKDNDLANCRKNMELQRTAMESQKKVMEAQKKSVEDKLAAEQAKIQSLESELESCKQELTEASKNIAKKSSAFAEIQSELSETQVKLSGSQSMLKDSQAALKETKHSLKTALDEISDLKATLEDTNLQLDDTKQELDAVRALLDAAPVISVVNKDSDAQENSESSNSIVLSLSSSQPPLNSNDLNSRPESSATSITLSTQESRQLSAMSGRASPIITFNKDSSSQPVAVPINTNNPRFVTAEQPEQQAVEQLRVEQRNMSEKDGVELEPRIFVDSEKLDRQVKLAIADTVASTIAGLQLSPLECQQKIYDHCVNLWQNILPLVQGASSDDWALAMQESFTSIAFCKAKEFILPVVGDSSLDQSLIDEMPDIVDVIEAKKKESPPPPEEKIALQVHMAEEGGTDTMSKIRAQDFQWLVDNGFADEQLAALARLLNQQNLELYSADDFERESIPTQLTPEAVQSSIDRLVNEIGNNTNFYALGNYYKRTADRILLMSSFTSWRLVKEYKDGGVFLDTVVANMNGLKKVIAAKGGWKAALKEVDIRGQYDEETSTWPEFFRIKVLELFRHRARVILASERAHIVQLQNQVALLESVPSRRASKEAIPAQISSTIQHSQVIPAIENDQALPVAEHVGQRRRTSRLQARRARELSEVPQLSPVKEDLVSGARAPPSKADTIIEHEAVELSPRSARDNILQIANKRASRLERRQKLEAKPHALSSSGRTVIEVQQPVVVEDRIELLKKAKSGKDLVEAIPEQQQRQTSFRQPKIVSSQPVISDVEQAVIPVRVDETNLEAEIVTGVDDEQLAMIELERASVNAQKKKTIQSLSVKAITRKTVKQSIAARESPEVAPTDVGVATPAVDPRVVESKVGVAVQATAALVESKIQDAFVVTGQLSATSAQQALKDLQLRTEEPASRKVAYRSLHKYADDMGFLLMHGEEETEILVEIVLEAIDCYLDGYTQDAIDLAVMAKDYCQFPAEQIFVESFLERLSSGTDFQDEASEISDKLNSMLSIMEAFGVQTPELPSHGLSPAPVLSRGGTPLPLPLPPKMSRAPTPSGGIAALPSRGPTPEQIETLKLSLQDNRIKRLHDRESVHQLTSQMKEEVAVAIASALVNAARECVEISTQTDLPDVFVEVTAPIDTLSGAQTSDAVAPGQLMKMQSTAKFGEVDAPPDQSLSSGADPVGLELDPVDAGSIFDTILAALPPGFKLVKISDGQLELSPGVFLASYTHLTAAERNVLPRGIAYCYRETDAAYVKGIKRVPRYVMGVPKVSNCEAVLFPRVYVLNEDISLIMDISLEPYSELPPDIYVVQMIRECVLPDGMSLVELSPIKEIPIAFPIPPGLELVQVQLAVQLPPTVMISPECEIVKPPREMPPLPHNVQLIKRAPGAQLPSFMTLLATTSKDETELLLHSKMEDGCTIIKKPMGVEFGLGMELISRQTGCPMPRGMSPVPTYLFPKNLRLSGNLEVVMLAPRFDLPKECRPAPNWLIYPRPTGVRLALNTYLVQFEGERGGGLLPDCMRRVPFPDVPYGLSLPKGLIAIEFLPGAGYPLPFGTELVPGVVVLSPQEGLAAISTKPGAQTVNMDAIVHALPVNAVLVRRRPGAPIPADIERASGGCLPPGVLLAQNVEIWLLSVRFEVPPGVKIEAGALLGRNTQMAPGTVLSRDLEVVEWPRDLRLAPGSELVRLTPGSDLPVGYLQVAYSRAEMHSLGLSREVYVVKLPQVIRIQSEQQLAEKITVLSVDEFVANCGHTVDESIRKLLCNSLAPGAVLILRDSRRFQLPSSMSLLSINSLAPELRSLLTEHNVAVPSALRASKSAKSPNRKSRDAMGSKQKKRSRPRDSPTSRTATLTSNTQTLKEKTYLDVVQVRPMFRFPVGTELAPGVVVQERPFFMQFLPSWVELVSISDGKFAAHAAESDERFEFGKRLLTRLQFLRTSLRPEVNPFLSFTYSLPVGTELILIPDDIQVFSWGPNAPGIEAVVQPRDIWLPPGHFLVERPRGIAPPIGLLMGYAEEYERLAYRLKLPPGIEIMHIVATYPLPLGINLMSSAILQMPTPELSRSLATVPRHLQTPVGLLQFSGCQYLGWGVVTLPNPTGWTVLDVENALTPSKGIDGVFSTEVESDQKMLDAAFHDIQQVLLFIWIDPLDFRLPDGASILPCSDEIVSKYFSAYPGFEKDHAGHVPHIHRFHKRRASFEEAPAIIRRRSITVVPDSDLGGMVATARSTGRTTPAQSEDQFIDPGPGGISITQVIKLISLPRCVPAARDRYKQNRKKDDDATSEDDNASNDNDDHLVHARVSMLPELQPEQPQAPAMLASTGDSSVPRQPEQPQAPAILASTGDSSVPRQPEQPQAPAILASTGDSSVPLHSLDVVDGLQSTQTSETNSPNIVATVQDDSSNAKAITEISTAVIVDVRPQSTGDSGASNPQSRVSTADNGRLGFEPLARPKLTGRMGIEAGMMGIEGAKPPDYQTLLSCLEQAQCEIDNLEVENNNYRTKTTTAQREIEYLKVRLDRITNNQKSRQEEFKFARDQITELKGSLAKAYKTIELREIDSLAMKKKLEEKNERLQTQIDIVTTQLALWKDATNDVQELTAQHKVEVEKMQKNFQIRLKRSLDQVLAGSKHLVDVLVESMRGMLRGMLADIKLSAVQMVAKTLPFAPRNSRVQLMEKISGGTSTTIVPNSSNLSIADGRMSDDFVNDDVSIGSITVVSADASSVGSFSIGKRDTKTATAAPGFIVANPIIAVASPAEFIPIAANAPQQPAVASSAFAAAAARANHSMPNKPTPQVDPTTLLAAQYEMNDQKFLGVMHLPPESETKSMSSTITDSFLSRLDNICGVLTQLQDLCAGKSKNKIRMRRAEAETPGQNGDGDDVEQSDDAHSHNAGDEFELDEEVEVVSTPGVSAYEQDNDATKEVVDKMNKMSAELRPVMALWVTDLVGHIRHAIKLERAEYLKALQMSDLESQLMNKRLRSVDRKMHELESKLTDARHCGEGAAPETFPLHEKISSIQEQLDRLTDVYMNPLIESIRQQAAEYSNVQQIENSLRYQILVMKSVVKHQEELLAGKTLTAAETKAVRHRVETLHKQIAQYCDRLAGLEMNKTLAMNGIVADVQSFHKSLSSVMPSGLLPKIIHWSTMRENQTMKQSDVAEEIQQLSPNRALNSADSDRVDANDNFSIGDASEASYTSSQSVKLDMAQQSLSQPLSRLKFGSVGTMPPAPTRSLFNLDNILLDSKKPEKRRINSKRASATLGAMSQSMSIPDLAAAEPSLVLASRIQPKQLRPLKQRSDDSVYRGGANIVASNALTLPSIGLNIRSVSPKGNN